MSNHLKWIANEFPVTLRMVGVELAKKGLFGEGTNGRDTALAQTGRRTTRLGLRPFTIDTEAGRREWRQMLLALEQRVVLTDKHPGMVADDGPGEERRGIRGRPPRTSGRAGAETADQPPAVPEPTSRMTPPARTLPIRLPPLPGEALDSWLEATARRMGTTLGDVLLHFGFPVRQRAGNQFRGIPTDWTIFLDEQQITAVAHATGTAPEAVAALTLAHYDGRALQLSAGGRAVSRHVLWGRGRGSRFCPDCLHSSEGRWQLSWRLGFSFACTRHRRLLADRCPHCGRVPRQRPRSGRSVPRLELCGNPPIRPGGPVTAGCGADLTRTSTLLLPQAIRFSPRRPG